MNAKKRTKQFTIFIYIFDLANLFFARSIARDSYVVKIVVGIFHITFLSLSYLWVTPDETFSRIIQEVLSAQSHDCSINLAAPEAKTA